MPFLLPRSLVCAAPSTQGHIEAAQLTGQIYYFGQGVAIDYPRAMAAYKIGAEAGNAGCQYQLGVMYQHGRGIDSPDYAQALVWYEKAAAQDLPVASCNLGLMAMMGLAQTPSLRRARKHFQRAIDLGEGAESMQLLTECIQQVTRSHAENFAFAALTFPPARPSSPPSWTSGSRSTAPPA